MKKLYILVPVIALVLLGIFTSVGMAIGEKKAMQEEISALREHNQRLLKNLELSQGKQKAAVLMAANIETGNEQLAEAITETHSWLAMAELALDEMDRVIRENDNPNTNIPIILKDLREVIQQARFELGQAPVTEESNG